MGRESHARLGWQGWLWMAILVVCLAALAIGIGFRYGMESTERSADLISSGNVGPPVDVPQTINLFPASTTPGSERDDDPLGTSTPVAGVLPTIVLGSSTDRPSTTRPAAVSTATSRPSTVSTATSRPSAASTTTSNRPMRVSVTTASAQAARLSFTVTPLTAPPSTAPPSTRPTTSTARPTTTSWSGPVAVDDQVATKKGEEVKPNVLDNDAPGGASLDKSALSITAGPANAKEYKVHDDHLHYKPADGFVGVDRIRYRICDVAGRCDTATVTITVG